MPSLGTAAVYGVRPALVGLSIGLSLLGPARAVAPNGHAAGKLLVLASLMLTAPVLAFVAAVVASGNASPGVEDPVLVVGTVAGLQAIAQGLVIRGGFPAVIPDPTSFGRLLVRTVLPETGTLAAFAWFFARVQP